MKSFQKFLYQTGMIICRSITILHQSKRSENPGSVFSLWRLPFKTIMLLIIILNLSIYAYVQQHNIRFHHITIKDCLSQSSVYSILQSSKGFLWPGTGDGLNKYNGCNIKVYRSEAENPHSLGYNYVRVIYEELSGRLCIGTEDGVNKFDPQKERFTRYKADPSDSKSLSNNYIYSIQTLQKCSREVVSFEDKHFG